jgi:hypothetical protein
MQLNFGMFSAAIAEDVADDPHGRRGRIDVGVADHELFQNVVLNGPAQVLRLHALLFGGHDIERHHRQHRAVHGHRNDICPERNLVEENLHVFDRIDGHAGLADVAHHALIVGIVAAMGGQIERHRKALLAGRQIAPVKAFDSSAVEKPAYWRMVHGCMAYMVEYGPRRNGGTPAAYSRCSMA